MHVKAHPKIRVWRTSNNTTTIANVPHPLQLIHRHADLDEVCAEEVL